MINKNKTGIMLGTFLGFWHVLWSALVGIGAAQGILDFIYRIHFLNNPFQVQAFNINSAMTLVIITAMTGYLIGWICAAIWNKIQKIS